MIVLFLRKIKHFLFTSRLALQRKYRILVGKPVIHVFGDSHSLLFEKDLFIIHHIGPATAFKLNSDTSTTQSKKKIDNVLREFDRTKPHMFLFIFGEIDCRLHINKASKSARISLEKVIWNTVTAYGNFLKEIKDKYPQSTFIVLNVLPPGEQKNIYQVKHYASRQTQLAIRKQFNKTLREFCNKNNMIFLSLFNELLDDKDKRLKQYVFDNIHYNNKILPLMTKDLETIISDSSLKRQQ